MFRLPCVLLCFISLSLHAQIPEWHKKSKAWMRSTPERAYLFADSARNLAKLQGQEMALAQSELLVGEILMQEGNFSE